MSTEIGLITRDGIIESAGSLKARRHADKLGEIQGSSYTNYDGEPIAWAFAIAVVLLAGLWGAVRLGW